MKKLVFLPVIFLALFVSCKKDNIKPLTSTVTPVMAADSLYNLMNIYYYWYNLMPKVTEANYDDPYKLLDAMMYKTLDRWSFVADYDEFNAEMAGTFVGHGFRIGLDDSDKARIAMIYANSPLYANGVRRGWIVKTINGQDVATVLKKKDATAYTALIGASQAGITNIFVFTKPDSTDETITSTKSTFTLNSVLLYDTLHLSQGVTGHLVFDSFITPSSDELITAFTFFKANNIKDLIIDLRYNGGGYLYIAPPLASYIVGNSVAGTVFATLKYNDKFPDQNYSFNYISTAYNLDLPRIVVITSRSTASASEALMNGLKPYVNIVTIGDTTNGKPVGMNGWAIGKKYWFWPITFKIVNAKDEGDYFSGISPNKVLSDDITHDFNDREELCLKEAIHYLETGSVSAKGAETVKRNPQFSEKHAWMNSAIVLDRK